MLLDLDHVMFSYGGHATGSARRCAAEEVNAQLGLPWGASCPPCVHPAARPLWGLIVPLNDAFPDQADADAARTAAMVPLLRAILSAGAAPPESGGWEFVLADLAARRFAPRALRAAGLDAEAERLEAMPQVSAATVRAAEEATRAVWAEAAARSARAVRGDVWAARAYARRLRCAAEAAEVATRATRAAEAADEATVSWWTVRAAEEATRAAAAVRGEVWTARVGVGPRALRLLQETVAEITAAIQHPPPS
ncbi:MAG TPA: hypothetical protein VEI97_14740 [bacterium]|nr:hypothetical protein [bacterium]